MNYFTNRQMIVLCVLSMGVGSLMGPPMQGAAQPPEGSGTGEAQPTETPQPSGSDRTTRAVGTITGQGSTGYISKFTGANAIGNSALFESSGKVGLGTKTPTAMFSANSTTDNVAAITGTHSNIGIGVFGQAANADGVLGHSNSGAGVRGRHLLGSGTAPGVSGETNSTSAGAKGVQGIVQSTTSGDESAGVRGINNGTESLGMGVYGSHAGSGYGVYGTSSRGYGVYGLAASSIGVVGSSTSGYGVYGSSGQNIGVYGYSSGGTGVNGNSSSGTAVNAVSYSGVGVKGSSTNNVGVSGISTNYFGVYGQSNVTYGIYGYSPVKPGVAGTSDSNIGVFGKGFTGVQGESNGAAGSFAGVFSGRVYVIGNLQVTGNISKGSGSFKIDHPQHPATEYLSHSFVESPDMMNVYNGNTTTDAKGEAWVQLPSYFQSLNRDFRYQLTPIGQFAQAIVGQEIQGTRFQIKTDKPKVKVSWMVTGIRNDAYARANRIRVEENKLGNERGKYLYPAGFGFGKDKQIGSNMTRLAAR